MISADHKYSALFFILLTAITIIAYSEVTQHQLLNWDDLNYVIHNDQTLENVVWMFTD